jgi:hypothetical protein
MYRLAVMVQSLIREWFRVAAGFSPFGPSIPVTVQGDALNAKLPATRSKFRRPVTRPHPGQIRKQHPLRWQVFEQVQYDYRHAGFLPGKTHRAVIPVNIFALYVRNLALACLPRASKADKASSVRGSLRRR